MENLSFAYNEKIPLVICDDKYDGNDDNGLDKTIIVTKHLSLQKNKDKK